MAPHLALLRRTEETSPLRRGRYTARGEAGIRWRFGDRSGSAMPGLGRAGEVGKGAYGVLQTT